VSRRAEPSDGGATQWDAICAAWEAAARARAAAVAAALAQQGVEVAFDSRAVRALTRTRTRTLTLP